MRYVKKVLKLQKTVNWWSLVIDGGGGGGVNLENVGIWFAFSVLDILDHENVIGFV